MSGNMTDENLRAWSIERAIDAGPKSVEMLIKTADAIFSYVRGDEEDEGCPCEECEEEADMDTAREAAFVLFASLIGANYSPEAAQEMLEPVADALDIEFYFELEEVH